MAKKKRNYLMSEKKAEKKKNSPLSGKDAKNKNNYGLKRDFEIKECFHKKKGLISP